MFVSIDGKAKEVKEIFAGGSDGLAHKINEVFGSVNGVAKLVYTSDTKEHNAFDNFTWAEIKQLADEGRLLEHFNRFDKVTIKLKQPLVETYNGITFYQDMLPMVISEISETGMRLVSYIATPYRFVFRIDNGLYASYIESSLKDRDVPVGTSQIWGMCSGLYNNIKKIDNALPTDMREVLTDFAPLYKYEYYTDEEGRQRIRQEYDDCRVRQITSNGYSYHREYVKERDRYEYVLDTSYFARTESGYKKYVPDTLKTLYNECYGIDSLRYHSTYSTTTPYWTYKLMWQDPDIAWIWDWENYYGTNEHNKIADPIYKTTYPNGSNIIPEVQIGEIA